MAVTLQAAAGSCAWQTYPASLMSWCDFGCNRSSPASWKSSELIATTHRLPPHRVVLLGAEGSMDTPPHLVPHQPRPACILSLIF